MKLMRSPRITNRSIAGLGGYSLPQVRRWAVLVLGKDPEADKGRGVKRFYNLDEAYKIYLAGSFITILDKSLEETKTYLNYVWPAFKRENLLPSLLQENYFVKNYKDDIFEFEEFSRYTLVLQPYGLCYLIITLEYKQIGPDTYEKTCKNIPIYPEDINYTFPESTEGLPQWNVILDNSLFFFMKNTFNIPGANRCTNLWEFQLKLKESGTVFPG